MCLRALWLWNPRSPESQTPNLQIPHESSRWCKLEFKVSGGGNTPLLSWSATSVCLSLNRRALSKSCMHTENLHFPEAEFDFVFVTQGGKKQQKKWVEMPEYVLRGGVYVCVLLNDLVNEKPVLERNRGGTLRVVDVPEEPSWQWFKTLIKHLRGLTAQRAGTLSQC